MRAAQVLERLFWVFVSAAGGALIAPAIFGFDLEAGQAALVAGTGAVVNAVTQLGRYRLSVLPDPGQGLPGLEVPKADP